MESAASKAPSGARKHTGAPVSSAAQPAKPPRTKRRPVVSQDDPDQPQVFYFVDQGSSTREKRAHVMRHHIREKRKQSKLANNADKQSARSSRYLPWRKKPGQEGEDGADGSPTSSYAPQSNALVVAGSTGAPCAAAQTASQSLPVCSGPTSMLSASKVDPFGTLPVPLDQIGYELVDFWTSKLTYWSGQNSHMKNVVFQTAMRHPVAFRAVILAYGSRWRARLYNRPDDPYLLLHVGQSEHAVQQAIRGVPLMDEDSLAMALTGLSLQEERFGNKSKAEEYADRALQILRPRTGSSLPIEIFLLYVRYITVPRAPGIDADGARWLVNFLRSAERLMIEQNRPSFLSLVPQRHSVFQLESPLYLLLSSGPHPSQVPDNHRIYVIRNAPTQRICRAAALIYITAALWDHRESPSRTARFLDHLVMKVTEHRLDRYPACESFVWLLLEESYDPDLRDPERAWSVGELLKMHKLLRPDLQFHFSEILLSFLMLNRPIRGVDSFEEELRKAIPS